MGTNRVRERWCEGGIVLDCWLAGPSMTTAEAVGRLGYDSVVIDMQPTMADLTHITRCLMALTGTGTAGLVRVPGLDALFSGPSDMSVSNGGRPGFDSNDPETAARHRRMADVAHAAGLKAGMLALRPHDVPRAIEWGMDLISVAMESRLVITGATEALERGRATINASGGERRG